jgi:hypothetical protein
VHLQLPLLNQVKKPKQHANPKLPKFAHIRVLVYSASSSNVHRRRFWMPYAIQTRHTLVWRPWSFSMNHGFEIWHLLKQVALLEGPEIHKSCFNSSHWKLSTGIWRSVF